MFPLSEVILCVCVCVCSRCRTLSVAGDGKPINQNIFFFFRCQVKCSTLTIALTHIHTHTRKCWHRDGHRGGLRAWLLLMTYSCFTQSVSTPGEKSFFSHWEGSTKAALQGFKITAGPSTHRISYYFLLGFKWHVSAPYFVSFSKNAALYHKHVCGPSGNQYRPIRGPLIELSQMRETESNLRCHNGAACGVALSVSPQQAHHALFHGPASCGSMGR